MGDLQLGGVRAQLVHGEPHLVGAGIGVRVRVRVRVSARVSARVRVRVRVRVRGGVTSLSKSQMLKRCSELLVRIIKARSEIFEDDGYAHATAEIACLRVPQSLTLTLTLA